MFATSFKKKSAKSHRPGIATVEFAVCLPVIAFLLLGLWEVGRMTEVQQVMWNSTREAARDASTGQANMLAVVANLQLYLQNAEPTAFGSGHSTSTIAPVVAMPANTTGYTVWDNTKNRELFTMTFTDVTTPSISDPTGMAQLDNYQIGVQVPYASIGWIPVAYITGKSRIYASVNWASMVDSPFQIAPYLAAQ